jgi:signal transduction histidine kinase
LPPDGEQRNEQQTRRMSEQQRSAPPPFASRPQDGSGGEPDGEQPAGTPATAEPPRPGAAFEDARQQLREQAERARSGVQQLLQNENQRLRTELTAAIQQLEQKLLADTQRRTDEEIARVRAAAEEMVA